MTAEPIPVRAEGARNCGCAWEHLDDGSVRFTSRCAEHREMCRSLEGWEINLPRPGARPKPCADHPARLAAETEVS
jgi:hypothetical protein